MPKNTIWVGEADDSEKGSFSDRASGHIYENGNITDAVEAETNANERGDEVVWIDAPIDEQIVYDVDQGQRFNIYTSEDDSRGATHASVSGPGR